MRASHLDVVHEAQVAYGVEAGKVRPAVPSASRIMSRITLFDGLSVT
jgi:hypothetical protein